MSEKNELLKLVREAVESKETADISALKEVAEYLGKTIEERGKDPEADRKAAEEWAKTLPDKEGADNGRN